MTTALRGGWVVDGTGRDRYRGDVLVADGHIAGVGPSLRGDLELDASGAVVAPGFVDLHTHYDAQVLWERAVTPSSWHGVTTVVMGNCGFGVAPCRPENRDLVVTMLEELEDMPRAALEAGMAWEFTTFGEYLDVVDRRCLHVNAAAFVGHSPVRFDVMGAAAYERPAEDHEITRMVHLVAGAIDSGAIGFATSSSPTGRRHPTKRAEYPEIAALVGVLGDRGQGLVSFVPAGNVGLDDWYGMQREVGRPFTYTALMARSDGSHLGLVERHLSGRAAGAQVHPQVSCRPLVFEATLQTSFALRAPSLLAMEHAGDEERLIRYADEAFRRQVESEFKAMVLPPQWRDWIVLDSPTHPELEGADLASVAAHRRCSGLDVALDLTIADRLATRFHVTSANDDPAEVTRLLNLEGTVLGLADSGAHPGQLCDAVLPTDLLGPWVRDRSALPLESAVRKLTGELTDLLGLAGRGYVRPGAVADLVVFEPDKIGPGPMRRVHDLPAGAERLVGDRPAGVRHVLVNGIVTRRNGVAGLAADAPGPGRVLRSG